jgi:PAS domain-containing protein
MTKTRSAEATTNYNGSLPGIVITQHRKVEDELFFSQTKDLGLSNSTLNEIIDSDAKGAVVSANQVAELMSGYEKGEDLGITERKEAELVVFEEREYAQNIMATMRESLLVLDDKLKVISANDSFYKTFEVTSKETEGNCIYVAIASGIFLSCMNY